MRRLLHLTWQHWILIVATSLAYGATIIFDHGWIALVVAIGCYSGWVTWLQGDVDNLRDEVDQLEHLLEASSQVINAMHAELLEQEARP